MYYIESIYSCSESVAWTFDISRETTFKETACTSASPFWKLLSFLRIELITPLYTYVIVPLMRTCTPAGRSVVTPSGRSVRDGVQQPFTVPTCVESDNLNWTKYMCVYELTNPRRWLLHPCPRNSCPSWQSCCRSRCSPDPRWHWQQSWKIWEWKILKLKHSLTYFSR